MEDVCLPQMKALISSLAGSYYLKSYLECLAQAKVLYCSGGNYFDALKRGFD